MRKTAMMRAFEGIDLRHTPRSPNKDPKVRAKLIVRVASVLERRYRTKARKRRGARV